jgi:cyclopropane fatty-acyl-phospholipid synthase-like methyltransferase
VNGDFFEHKADSYDRSEPRVQNVDNISQAIVRSVDLRKSMRLMDFGSGTGLLLERIAPYVAGITAVDISSAMNSQLEAKRSRIGCELEILEIDLETADIDRTFDGIISSMTLHHVRDIDALFAKFHRLLVPGGFIALADLDAEDGSFHAEDTGVHHLGFDRQVLAGVAEEVGFKDVVVTTASVVRKPQGDFPVFLLTACR